MTLACAVLLTPIRRDLLDRYSPLPQSHLNSVQVALGESLCDTTFRRWTPLTTEGCVSTTTHALMPNMQTRDMEDRSPSATVALCGTETLQGMALQSQVSHKPHDCALHIDQKYTQGISERRLRRL